MARRPCLLVVALLLLAASVAAQETTAPPDVDVDALMRLARGDARDARREAMDALLGRDDPRLAGMVLSLLDEARDEAVIEDVLRGAGRHGVEAALEPALSRLRHRSPGVRAHAAVCLERLGSEKAVPALLERAARERDATVLKNILRALGRTGANRPDVASSLVKRFRHRDSIVAANAILACSGFTEEGRVRSIVAGKIGDMLVRTGDIRVRWACLCALGSMGTKKEIPDLEKFVDSFRGSSHPLVQSVIRSANRAIESIRSAPGEGEDGSGFERLFRVASNDERDAARDGDPDKPVPAWLDRDSPKPSNRNGPGKWR